MGKNGVIVSLHKNYTDFSNFMVDLLAEEGHLIDAYDTLLVSLEARIIKPFSLKYLAELKEK